MRLLETNADVKFILKLADKFGRKPRKTTGRKRLGRISPFTFFDQFRTSSFDWWKEIGASSSG